MTQTSDYICVTKTTP